MRTLLAPTLALLATTACASDDTTVAPEPVSALTIEAESAGARVIRAQTTSVRVRVELLESDATITVTAEDLPTGVTAAPITLAPGATEGVLELVAGEGIALGVEATATLRATAADLEASAPLELRLTDRPGAIDRTFGTAGMITSSFVAASHEGGTSIERLADGKLVVAGVNVTGKEYVIARYDEHGAPDASFGNGGWMSISNSGLDVIAPALAVRSDGSMLLATYGGPTALLYGLDAKGDLLPGYGNAGGATVLSADTIGVPFLFRAMTATADGGCYVAGESTGAAVVARLRPDGKLDTSFDGDGIASITFPDGMGVSAIAVRADGRIVVSGWTNPPASGHSVLALAQLTADGALDAAFDSDGRFTLDAGTSAHGTAATPLRDGRVAVAAGGTEGALLTVDGSGAYTQRSLGTLLVRELIETDEGVVAIGGSGPDLALARVSLDGAMDPRFGTDGIAVADLPGSVEAGLAATLDEHGRVVITGVAQAAGPEQGELLLTRAWL